MIPELPALDGDLVLEGELGAGGGGRVLAARQRSLDRPVAVKLVGGLARGDASHFDREARLMARVAHPGIVGLLRHGTLEGKPALVMERVDGCGLDALLLALAARGGRPEVASFAAALGATASPWPRRTPWWRLVAAGVRDVARALDHAHRCGVLHRDVKPSNVLVARDGRVLLADFGVATESAVQGADGAGSLAYQAPELLRGEPASRTSDVYALGALLHEWACLDRPHGARGAAALVRAIDRSELRPLPRHLPRGLAAIRDRAMAARPAARYGTCGDLARDLDALLQGRALAAVPEAPWRRWARGARRHRRAVATGALLVASVTTAASAYEVQRLANARQVSAAAAQARGHLDLAVDALSGLLIHAATGELRGQPLLDRKRRQLLALGLEETLALAEDLEGEPPSVVRALARAEAEAALGLADVERRLGQVDRAVEHLAAAERAQASLPAEEREALAPRVAYARFVLARARGAFQRAEAEALAALEVLDPDVAAGRGWELRSSVWSALAEAALGRGDLAAAAERAEAGAREAEEILARALAGAGAEHPRAQVAARELARILGTRSGVLVEAADLDGAEAAALRSIELVEALPPGAELRSIAAISFDNLAAVRSRRADVLGAVEARREALSRHRLGVAAFPDAPELRFDLARSARALAEHLGRLGQGREERVQLLGEAESAARTAAHRMPDSAEVHGMWAWAARERAAAAEALGRWGDAHSAYESALVAATRAHALSAGDWPSSALRSLWARRMPLLLSNRPLEGSAEVERYVETFPADPDVAWDAGALLAALARSRARGGADADELRALGTRCLELLERAVELGLTGRAAAGADTRLSHLRGVPTLEALLARVPE